MTNLTEKFDELQAQLTGQHNALMLKLDDVITAIGNQPTNTVELAAIAGLLTSINGGVDALEAGILARVGDDFAEESLFKQLAQARLQLLDIKNALRPTGTPWPPVNSPSIIGLLWRLADFLTPDVGDPTPYGNLPSNLTSIRGVLMETLGYPGRNQFEQDYGLSYGIFDLLVRLHWSLNPPFQSATLPDLLVSIASQTNNTALAVSPLSGQLDTLNATMQECCDGGGPGGSRTCEEGSNVLMWSGSSIGAIKTNNGIVLEASGRSVSFNDGLQSEVIAWPDGSGDYLWFDQSPGHTAFRAYNSDGSIAVKNLSSYTIRVGEYNSVTAQSFHQPVAPDGCIALTLDGGNYLSVMFPGEAAESEIVFELLELVT